MKSPRKQVNLSVDAHLRLEAYCQKHSVNMGAWVSRLVLDTLNKEDAPTSLPSGPTPRQEQILASIRPSFNTPLIQHKPIGTTDDGETYLIKDDVEE